MKSETRVWLILLAVGGLFLIGRALLSEHGLGRSHVRATRVAADPDVPDSGWMRYDRALPRDYFRAESEDPEQTVYSVSIPRTLGLWLAAFFTLAIFSFLYRDNPLYKVAESVVVGVSAAYWMVVGFWTTIVPNLLGKLWPALVKSWAMPGLNLAQQEPEWSYLVPLVLGIMLVWRLAPVGAWIARWPLAFTVGIFCGLRLVSFLHADFLSQIRNSVVPVAVLASGGGLDIWGSVQSLVLLAGVLCCLVYFFFSFEHKGVVGGTARVGIQFLMITFGAAFGFTVMGRIALLAIRLEFLFDDWLWLIDPVGKRLVGG